MQNLLQTNPKITLASHSKKSLRSNFPLNYVTQHAEKLRNIVHKLNINLLVLLCRAAFLIGLVIFVSHANAEWKQEREIYKKARKALANKQINQFQQYSSQLTDYPLYPYLLYEKLKFRFSSLTDQEIDEFLVKNDDGPLAERMRLAWLYQLQRKGNFESFLKYYQADKAAELQCYFLRARMQHGLFKENKKENFNQVRELWLVGKSQPKQCDPLFNWYEKQGYLTTDYIWERIALAMGRNRLSLAKYLIKKLPSKERPRAKLWLEVHNNPKTKLNLDALKKDNHINRQIVRHGMQRLAKKDLSLAHETWLNIQDNYAFGSDLHDEVERSLALRAAYRHDDRATTWMYQLPKELIDPSTSLWRARSALRSLDWDLVLRGIAMLNEHEKAEPQWQYWKARALAEKGLQSDAKVIYENIAGDRSYYGFLAADKLSKPYNIYDAPVQYDKAEFEKISQTPSIIRARELLLVNQLTDARREWNYATQNYSQREYQIAAYLAHQLQWHDYAIRTIAKGGYFDDLNIRFPMPFTSLITKYANKRKLEPAFIYGIIRRESAFNPHARSPAGARGLMQLMPATAKQVSRNLRLKTPTRYDLYKPSLNISLGSRYISDMLTKFDGHRALASAAYNAGPHRVKAWLPEINTLPADVWVDTIPFTETREYVRAILAYTALFEWKLDQTPTRLSVHLQPIAPSPDS